MKIIYILSFLTVIMLASCSLLNSPPAKPGAPVIISGDSQVFVYWQPVAKADSYEVWYGTENNTEAAVKYGDDVEASNTFITGLVNGTGYYVWIKAKNTAGSSIFSDPGSGTPSAGASTSRVYVSGTGFYVNGSPIWMNGCNTPWDNWNDFGGVYDHSFWETHYGDLHDNKVNASRVWITCSGEVGIDIDAAGHVSGATAAHWNDLDDFFAIAQNNGIYIMATLISFDHFKNSYSTCQRWRNWLNSDTNIDSYIDNYLVPFVERYGGFTSLWSIDLVNEPDWATTSEGGTLSWDRFQTYWAKAAKAIHDNSQVLVTVGMGVIKYNSDTCAGAIGNKISDTALRAKLDDDAVYIDFYSPHYYPWMDSSWSIPMYVTPATYGLGTAKPAVIGECPVAGSTDHTLTQDYENAYTNNWRGVMPWTSNSVDAFGGIENLAPATNAFWTNHPDLVFP
ncbi:MAG: hypothetical protein JW969_09640 [Spirochaetales bacterium]|nr:hypothetical protein [Spirochaetales bacterium]